MVATEQVYKKLADANANTSSLSGAQEDEVKCQACSWGRCQSVDLFGRAATHDHALDVENSVNQHQGVDRLTRRRYHC